MTDHSKLIARLKQQPRHGSALNDFNEAMKKSFALYEKGAADLMRENVFKILAKNIQDAYNEVNILEQRNRSLSDALKISTKRAAELGYALDKQGDALGINSAKLKQYASDLNKLIPGQTRFLSNQKGLGAKIAKQLDDMRNKLGLSADAYEQLLRNQTLFSKNGESVEAGIENFNRLLQDAATSQGQSFEGVQAAVAEIVSGMDSATAARFSRQIKNAPGDFIKSALAAKKLGLEMNKILAIGDNFLDVESAIATELELQLLGAKDLNVAEIQRAALAGDANALTQQLTKFLEANGELLKENPILLEKSAAAFNMQQSELLDTYAQMKLNNEVASQAEDIAISTAQTNSDIRSEETQLQDAAALQETAALLAKYPTPEAMVKQVTDIATLAQNAQTAALSGASAIAETLSKSGFITTLKGAVSLYNNVTSLYDSMKPGGATSIGTEVLGRGGATATGNDLFIPAGGSDTVISGPFGAFTMNPGDDILAAPGIREAGGGGTSAVIAALSKMSFHVTNVFDGDKIKSSLEIRQGQTLNNINNIA